MRSFGLLKCQWYIKGHRETLPDKFGDMTSLYSNFPTGTFSIRAYMIVSITLPSFLLLLSFSVRLSPNKSVFKVYLSSGCKLLTNCGLIYVICFKCLLGKFKAMEGRVERTKESV